MGKGGRGWEEQWRGEWEGEGNGKGEGGNGKREGKGEGRRSVPANKNLRLHPWIPLIVSDRIFSILHCRNVVQLGACKDVSYSAWL